MDSGKSTKIGFDAALDQPWWKRMTKAFTAPDYAANPGFTMRISFKEGRFWVDNVTVLSSDDRVDLMENGSFEKDAVEVCRRRSAVLVRRALHRLYPGVDEFRNLMPTCGKVIVTRETPTAKEK